MHPLPFLAAAPLRRTVAHTLARLFSRTLAGASLAMTALVAVAPAHADSRNMLPRNELAAYTQECAACHMAFAPGFLQFGQAQAAFATSDDDAVSIDRNDLPRSSADG